MVMGLYMKIIVRMLENNLKVGSSTINSKKKVHIRTFFKINTK